MSNQLVPDVYTHVIDEVCDAVSSTFAEMGVGQNVLAELRQVWKQKIAAARIADFDFADDYDGQYPPYDDGTGGDYYPTDGVDPAASFTAASNLAVLAAASATTSKLGGLSGRMPQQDGASDEPGGEGVATGTHVMSQKEIDAMVQKLWAESRVNDEPVPRALRKASRRIGQHDGVDDDDDEEDEDDNEDGINSELDDDDSEDDSYDPQHLILCQYEKVNRVKNKWKCALKDGIITVNGRDYVFNKANGEFEW
ncbi:transcription factor IIA, alpha/beta subunit-domain-containing protein [Powellomyces hirtus]|nr:transcription factor IIA, alpha/beta subunit-domain-containing protein [Powellomyces hirtus]